MIVSMIYRCQFSRLFGLSHIPHLLNYSLPVTSNDTTKAIEFCIRYSIDSFHMPSVGSAMKKGNFGDSILLTSEKLPLKYLPLRVDSINFKIMNRKKICQLLMDNIDFDKQPNYFLVQY